jgi:hypothetical protein
MFFIERWHPANGLADLPAEWSRQYRMLGLPAQ